MDAQLSAAREILLAAGASRDMVDALDGQSKRKAVANGRKRQGADIEEVRRVYAKHVSTLANMFALQERAIMRLPGAVIGAALSIATGRNGNISAAKAQMFRAAASVGVPLNPESIEEGGEGARGEAM